MSNYDKAIDTMENLGRGVELGALQAQVWATLALVDAQREATEWGKEQIVIMRDQQTQFLADLKSQLANDE